MRDPLDTIQGTISEEWACFRVWWSFPAPLGMPLWKHPLYGIPERQWRTGVLPFVENLCPWAEGQTQKASSECPWAKAVVKVGIAGRCFWRGELSVPSRRERCDTPMSDLSDVPVRTTERWPKSTDPLTKRLQHLNRYAPSGLKDFLEYSEKMFGFYELSVPTLIS